ncbi:MAG: hypothetical protein QXI10_01385 [Candidatus Diapherotrites archaeon]
MFKAKKTLFGFFLLTLFSNLVFGISAIEAVNLVVSSNNYLYDGETYSAPNVPILYENKEYWVIPLTAGNEVLTYFPVEVKTGVLSESREINRGLMKLSDIVRETQLLKASIASKSLDWPFTDSSQKLLEEVSQQLKDESFQINTAETILKSKKAGVSFSKVKSILDEFAQKSYEASQIILEAKIAEAEFFKKPSPDALAEMQESYESAFLSIEALNNLSAEYRAEIDKIKQALSIADIDAHEKAQISQLVDSPQGILVVRKLYLDSLQIRSSIDSINQKTNLKVDSLLIEFDNRIAKNRAHQLIYSENEQLAKEGFSSLSEVQNYILSKENIELWKSQDKVGALRQNYSRAVDYYKKKNYAQAEKYAKDAIQNSLSILKEGKIQTSNSANNSEMLLQLAGVLLVLLVVLYIFNNRGRIKEAFKGKKEEIEIYG